MASATPLAWIADTVDMVLLTGEGAAFADRDTLFEAFRVPKTWGTIVLMNGLYVSLPGTVSTLTDALTLQFNPFWQSQGR